MSLAGKLLYKLYYGPRNQRAIVEKYGGKEAYQAMLDAEAQMRAYTFSELTFPPVDNRNARYTLHFLSGDKFMHQTLFCIYSFCKFLTEEERSQFAYRVYDDGSLSPALFQTVRERFPFVEIVPYTEMLAKVKAKLPVKDFPYLHTKLKLYPIIYKLVFVHLFGKGPQPILDSDMLFVQRPDELIDWIKSMDTPRDETFYIQDLGRYYGYSDVLMESIAGPKLPAMINGGLYILQSEKIDFAEIESLIRELEEAEGSQYYLEQALIAILASRYKKQVTASKSRYIVGPSKEDVHEQKGVLHHFVNTSKEFYFKEGWRKAIEGS